MVLWRSLFMTKQAKKINVSVVRHLKYLKLSTINTDWPWCQFYQVQCQCNNYYIIRSFILSTFDRLFYLFMLKDLFFENCSDLVFFQISRKRWRDCWRMIFSCLERPVVFFISCQLQDCILFYRNISSRSLG